VLKKPKEANKESRVNFLVPAMLPVMEGMPWVVCCFWRELLGRGSHWNV